MSDYAAFIGSNLFSCIVTGGATGLGKGIALALAINGAKVVIVGRRAEALKAAADDITAAAKASGSDGLAIAVTGDVSDKAGVVALYDKVVPHLSKVDVLVNCAGQATPWKYLGQWDNPDNLDKMLWSIEDTDFASMTAVHVAGPYFLTIKLLPLLRKAADPCVVNISSIASHFLNRKVVEFSYSQSKAAEEGLTRLMAAGLLTYKIRVNSIQPGLFPSQLTVAGGKYFKPMEESIADIPKGRPGLIEEVAGPVLMMASPAGSYLNGVSLIVDGGWTMTASASQV
ncbi:hypothetical protein Q5752_000816 [Cryptotrichosporon argae]